MKELVPSPEDQPVELDPVLFWAQHTLAQYRTNIGFTEVDVDRELNRLREAS